MCICACFHSLLLCTLLKSVCHDVELVVRFISVRLQSRRRRFVALTFCVLVSGSISVSFSVQTP